MVLHTDTVVAIATPPGRGGLGIVRVSGPASRALAIAVSGRSAELTPRYAHYSRIHDAAGQVIDSGLLLYFPAPHSSTGEDVLEIHAHGSRVVLQQIVDHLLAAGARMARPGEFTERAYHNGKIDLLQAEAVADLIDAVSSQAARSAMRSLSGVFSDRINSLLALIIQLRTQVEAALDFPDEDIDVTAEAKTIRQQLDSMVEALDDIFRRAQQGAVLKQGIKLAIVGKPNAGKSTLLNRLAGSELAIVTEIPGTTRDLVAADILLDGVPVHLVDTAGLRDAADPIEQEGIRRAHRTMSTADIVVYVADCRDSEAAAESWLQPYRDKKQLHAVNKIDLCGMAADSQVLDENTVRVCLSAKTGAGMDLFLQQLKVLLGIADLSEDVFMARQRHLQALERTRAAILAGRAHVSETVALELLAEELRHAQEALGEITGKFVADDLLGSIFSSFCIGK